MPRCQATTRGGGECKARALRGSPFCYFHQPDARHKITASRGGTAASTRVPPSQTVTAALAALSAEPTLQNIIGLSVALQAALLHHEIDRRRAATMLHAAHELARVVAAADEDPATVAQITVAIEDALATLAQDAPPHPTASRPSADQNPEAPGGSA